MTECSGLNFDDISLELLCNVVHAKVIHGILSTFNSKTDFK